MTESDATVSNIELGAGIAVITVTGELLLGESTVATTRPMKGSQIWRQKWNQDSYATSAW